ncbi:hypothetical protein F2Q65_09335 [Thiohalocapsa marina]|uniref:Uncharacterized protein n=1 Tax=Thiohalocapsa marina TaxID=424902 RepID=A0A5M8FSL6_9GAMM|nr:hypothetical protein [Thiohalocapsa marina]KAA6185292.1 hypothetical protein F2Q65_09335 [Thiohalocapsa marina]
MSWIRPAVDETAHQFPIRKRFGVATLPTALDAEALLLRTVTQMMPAGQVDPFEGQGQPGDAGALGNAEFRRMFAVLAVDLPARDLQVQQFVQRDMRQDRSRGIRPIQQRVQQHGALALGAPVPLDAGKEVERHDGKVNAQRRLDFQRAARVFQQGLEAAIQKTELGLRRRRTAPSRLPLDPGRVRSA